MVKYFQTLNKQEIKDMQNRATIARRSPQLQKAWKDQAKIQQMYNEGTMKPKEIAEQYGINVRSAYRIIDRPPVDKPLTTQ